MKKLLILLCCLLPVVLQGQIITTIAGTGISGFSGDGGPAISAQIAFPLALKFAKDGSFYFSEVLRCRIRKVTPAGIITTIAGAGSCGYNGDGIAATSAQLKDPKGIAIDSMGNIYIADGFNDRVRKINMGTGIITTVAGNGSAGFSGDNGPATAAMLHNPYDVCFDHHGNLYIADENNFRVRKVNTSGIITTYAGNGSTVFSGEGGPATAAGIYSILGLCVNKAGDLFIAGRFASRVFKVSTSGILTTIAGNGLGYSTGDGGPASAAQLNPEKLAMDREENLYISCIYKNCVRKIDAQGIITTVAGDTTAGYYGDNGPAISAKLHNPEGIGFDSCGNLYISDKVNHRIRKVSFNPACAPVGVNPVTEQHDLSIYPNPTNHLLHIDNLQTNAGYRILSIVGTAIQQGQLHAGSNELNIRDLPPGMYLLEVNEDGKRTIQKIVVN